MKGTGASSRQSSVTHMGEAALDIPFPLPHGDVVFVGDYNNREHGSFLPRAKIECTGISLCLRLIFLLLPLSD